MKYELYVKFSNGTSMKEQFCTFEGMKKIKRSVLENESNYKLTIKPMLFFNE